MNVLRGGKDFIKWSNPMMSDPVSNIRGYSGIGTEMKIPTVLLPILYQHPCIREDIEKKLVFYCMKDISLKNAMLEILEFVFVVDKIHVIDDIDYVSIGDVKFVNVVDGLGD